MTDAAGLTGGFSRATELIKHEHGTSHKDLLDMPICLLRQTVELIRQRRTDEARLSMKIAEWQAKQIAGIIVNTSIDINEQGRKQLMRSVQDMKLETKEEVADLVPEDPDNPVDEFDFIESGARIDEERIGIASAEMFMAVARGGPQ